MDEMLIENVNDIISDAKKLGLTNLSYDEFYAYFTADFIDKEIELAYKRLVNGYNEMPRNYSDNYYSYHGVKFMANKLTRSMAKEICLNNGIKVTPCFTLAKENSGANTYWMNPNINCINEDWTIILNDYKVKTLHVFKIPAYTLAFNHLKTRADIPTQFDIQINVNSASYQDIRSKIRFGAYHIADIKY